jgi:zinc transporter ZupT
MLKLTVSIARSRGLARLLAFNLALTHEALCRRPLHGLKAELFFVTFNFQRTQAALKTQNLFSPLPFTLYLLPLIFMLLQLLLLGVLAGAANIVGGLILYPTGVYSRFKSFLKYFLALGAGFMLAVTFVELLPKTYSLWKGGNDETLIVPMGLVLTGYLLTQFFEHTIAPHIHLGEEVHHCEEHIVSSRAAYTAIGGLLIHTFFDGISISAASQVDSTAGILVFVAVFLHKFPEGFTVASLVLAAGKDFRQVLIATSLIGFTTFLGVLIGGTFGLSVKYMLPVASGVTLYVAASDLIPEVNHHGGKKPSISLSVFAGVALFFLLHYFLHSILEH